MKDKALLISALLAILVSVIGAGAAWMLNIRRSLVVLAAIALVALFSGAALASRRAWSPRAQMKVFLLVGSLMTMFAVLSAVLPIVERRDVVLPVALLAAGIYFGCSMYLAWRIRADAGE